MLPRLLRRRYIPLETIELKDDEIIKIDENSVITKWKVLHPRHAFTNGVSVYCIDEGIKVSKFFNDDGDLVYYYCDIIETEIQKETNTYVFNDLLADVIIYPDGKTEVVDIGEIPMALDEGVIDIATAKNALTRLDNLLKKLYKGFAPDVAESYFGR